MKKKIVGYIVTHNELGPQQLEDGVLYNIRPATLFQTLAQANKAIRMTVKFAEAEDFGDTWKANCYHVVAMCAA